MALRAIGVAAVVACTSAARIVQKGLRTEHSPFERHSNANCFVHQGGEPVDPQGDPPLHDAVTADECMAACDESPQCVGVTHQHLERACYLRKAIHVENCQSNPDYNTYTHPGNWVDPGDEAHDEQCGDLAQQPNLLCARHVEWAFSAGKVQPWGPRAYADMQVISGVSVSDATLEDFQRLSYCVNFRNDRGQIVDEGDPCQIAPCTCTNPPCSLCAIASGTPGRADVADVEFVPLDCPQPPDNGGCATTGTHNRYCASTRGCFSSAEEHLCPNLCPAPGDAPAAPHPHVTPPGLSTGGYGWRPGREVFGHWDWCRANQPAEGWSLNGGAQCNNGPPVNIKVLTYNLFWWNLFGLRGGMWQSAGRLIHDTGPYDIMGFQECDDVNRILADTGAGHEYGRYPGIHSASNAWRQTEWELLAQGAGDVAEDRRDQWYGRRGLVWVRVRHYHTGAVVFFANHHGPLPVGTGGLCASEATAYNILRVIAENAHTGDAVILTGDFNAPSNSRTEQILRQHLTHQYQGVSFGGVDNFYSNDCVVKVQHRNLGNGGSDHDALSVTFTVQR